MYAALYDLWCVPKKNDHTGPKVSRTIKKKWKTHESTVLKSPFRFDYLPFESKKAHQFLLENNLLNLVQSESQEFTKIAMILHWTHKQWSPHYEYKRKTLDEKALVQYKDKSFSAFDILAIDAPNSVIQCFAASFLFIQTLASLGFSARTIYVGNHSAVEVWSNEYGKWVYMDPYYDVYFLKDNIPLNWYDLHVIFKGMKTIWNEKRISSFQDVVLFYADYGITLRSKSFDGVYYDGPKNIPLYRDYLTALKSRSLDGIFEDEGTKKNPPFHYLGNHIFGPIFSVHLRNDHLENIYPKAHLRYHKYGKMNVLWKQKDFSYDYIRTNTTWTFSAGDNIKKKVSKENRLPFVWQTTENIQDLYWTINTTQIFYNIKKVNSGNAMAEVYLDTFTPNFSSFEIFLNEKKWEQESPYIQWEFIKGQKQILKVKAKNKYGHLGPGSSILLEEL